MPMAIISTSLEVPATIDQIWNIIADIDNESLYWHTGAIHNISKNGNIVKREVMVPFSMTWIKVSDVNSLNNGDLVGFD